MDEVEFLVFPGKLSVEIVNLENVSKSDLRVRTSVGTAWMTMVFCSTFDAAKHCLPDKSLLASIYLYFKIAWLVFFLW